MLKRFSMVTVFILLFAIFIGIVEPSSLLMKLYADTPTNPFKPRPLDIVLLIDQSPSMFKLSDPGEVDKNEDGTPKRENGHLVYKSLPIRQVAAQYFVDYLHVDQIPGVENRIGIIYFGGTAKVVAPLTKVVTDRDVKRLQDLLGEPPEPINWTDTNAAFEAAYKELFESSRSDPNREHVIVFLTDGHPQIAYPWPIEDSTREDGTPLEGKRSYYLRHKRIMERFKEKGVKLYTIIIARTGYVDWKDQDLQNPKMASLGLKDFVNLWQQAAAVTGGEYFRVSVDKNGTLNKSDLFPIYHAILAKMLNVSPIHRQQGDITSEDQTIPIPVGECRTLLVTVMKGSVSTQVTLMDPSNHPIPPAILREDYLIYKIKDPTTGNWWLRFRGGKGTSYNVSLDCADITLQARFLSPGGSSFQQCKPMPVVAKLITETGEPVTDAIVGVTVTLPDGTKRSIALDNQGNGEYSKEFNGTQQNGQYRFVLEGHQGDRVVKREKRVSVLPFPYLTIINPTPNLQVPGGRLVVQAGVKIGCELAKGSEDIGNGDAQVSAYLQRSDGSKIGPITLKDDGTGVDKEAGDAIFSGEFSQVTAGGYTLVATLKIPSLDVQDRVRMPLSVGLAPTATPTPTPSSTPTVTATPTVTPTPTPARAGHWIDRGKITARAGTEGYIPVHFNSAHLKDGQIVSVQIGGFPSGIVLKDTKVEVQPGKEDLERRITFFVSEKLSPAKGERGTRYNGELILTYPDGTTTRDPIEITVLPPPTSPWMYILTLLGLLLVGGGAAGGYMYVKGRGELVGTLVYENAPEGVDTMDVTLYGTKYDLILEGPVGYSSAITNGEWPDTESEYDTDEDYSTSAPGEMEEPLYVVLTFFARRGKQEAVVRVSEANKDVAINGVPLVKGEMHKLSDGDVIEAGEYRIRYEYLGSTESEEGYSDLLRGYEEGGYEESESGEYGAGYEEYEYDGYDEGYGGGDYEEYEDYDGSGYP